MKLAALDVRRDDHGHIQARRFDGRPMTAADRKEARIIALLQTTGLSRWIADEVLSRGNKLGAMKFCSPLLNDHVWIVRDARPVPADGLARYDVDELEILESKTSEQVVNVHKVKLAFPGCKVIQ